MNINKSGENIVIDNDKIILKEDKYVFKTILGDTPMYQGKYY